MFKFMPTLRLLNGNFPRLFCNLSLSIIFNQENKYATNCSATFQIERQYKLHRLDKGPSTTATLTNEDAMNIYEKLSILRQMETAACNMYKEKVIRGFCHLYIGQEAVAVGMHSMFRKVDTVLTSYRCHAWGQLMSGDVHGVLAEIAGRRTGRSRGKGGSMHIYANNFYGGNAIVGAQIPLGAGISFASKYRGDGGVCFTMYGDGASNQGQAFEAFNIAKLWSLPCAFVCENNMYGMGTSIKRSSASTEFYKRGDYIPGIWVDGMDVLATREATRFIIDHCSNGKGPLMVEMGTYRYTGHSMSDPGTSYRPREEIKEMRDKHDPINNFREKIISKGLVTDDQIKKIDKNIRTVVNEAVEQTKSEIEIGPEELAADIYSKNLHPFIRGIRPDTPLEHFNVSKGKKDIIPYEIK
ncbi:probable pyruvate dehydrogenase E1 component subunit alpha, mitochondrial [Battus philenor]|uniref:probable pyruvate dehydrogenase E1 component subunit alpha, mitochondrial n=1 Tax=Battus philenor TaxID=42288 RepID=UPI0035D0FA76